MADQVIPNAGYSSNMFGGRNLTSIDREISLNRPQQISGFGSQVIPTNTKMHSTYVFLCHVDVVSGGSRESNMITAWERNYISQKAEQSAFFCGRQMGMLPNQQQQSHTQKCQNSCMYTTVVI